MSNAWIPTPGDSDVGRPLGDLATERIAWFERLRVPRTVPVGPSSAVVSAESKGLGKADAPGVPPAAAHRSSDARTASLPSLVTEASAGGLSTVRDAAAWPKPVQAVGSDSVNQGVGATIRIRRNRSADRSPTAPSFSRDLNGVLAKGR